MLFNTNYTSDQLHDARVACGFVGPIHGNGIAFAGVRVLHDGAVECAQEQYQAMMSHLEGSTKC